MKSLTPRDRHWNRTVGGHLSPPATRTNVWSTRLRSLDSGAAILRSSSLSTHTVHIAHGAESSQTVTTSYAKFIGRVGALAVALGIGGAVATTSGVAWADDSSSSASSRSASSESNSSSASSKSSESNSSSASSKSSESNSPSASSKSSDSSSSTSSLPSPSSGSNSSSGGQTSTASSAASTGESESSADGSDTSTSSETVTTDESGVIVRSSGGSHTSGTDNQSVRGSQEDEAAAPDLEQPITPEEEVALQAPPETQVTTPPAAPTRAVAPTKKNSDTKKVAPLTAPTRTVAPIEKNSDTKKVIAGLQLRSSAVTATAGENDEWNDQSGGATFTTPPALASSASELVDLIDDDLAPFQDPGPMGPDSSVMWAALGWAHRRQFTERFANHTPVADLAQTTQVEPLGPAQAAPVEGVSALVAADPPIDAGVAAEQVGLVAQAAPVEGVSALVAADPPTGAGVAAEQVGLVAQAALVEAPTTTSIFFGAVPRVGEADGTVMVPIVRTGDLTRPSTIEYGITPDTATAGVDYVGGNGTITMDVGVDRVFIPVQILNDDLSEPTETFVVSITNVDSASTLLFPRTARIEILDDENPVVDPPSPPLTSNYIVTEQIVVSGY